MLLNLLTLYLAFALVITEVTSLVANPQLSTEQLTDLCYIVIKIVRESNLQCSNYTKSVPPLSKIGFEPLFTKKIMKKIGDKLTSPGNSPLRPDKEDASITIEALALTDSLMKDKKDAKVMVSITVEPDIGQFILNFMSNIGSYNAINDGVYKFVYCNASSVDNGAVFAVVILTDDPFNLASNPLNTTSVPSYNSLVPGRKPAPVSAKAKSKAPSAPPPAPSVVDPLATPIPAPVPASVPAPAPAPVEFNLSAAPAVGEPSATLPTTQ